MNAFEVFLVFDFLLICLSVKTLIIHVQAIVSFTPSLKHQVILVRKDMDVNAHWRLNNAIVRHQYCTGTALLLIFYISVTVGYSIMSTTQLVP